MVGNYKRAETLPEGEQVLGAGFGPRRAFDVPETEDSETGGDMSEKVFTPLKAIRRMSTTTQTAAPTDAAIRALAGLLWASLRPYRSMGQTDHARPVRGRQRRVRVA